MNAGRKKPWFDKECLLKMNLAIKQDPWKFRSVCTTTGGHVIENENSQLSTAATTLQYTIIDIKIPKFYRAHKNVNHRDVDSKKNTFIKITS